MPMLNHPGPLTFIPNNTHKQKVACNIAWLMWWMGEVKWAKRRFAWWPWTYVGWGEFTNKDGVKFGCRMHKWLVHYYKLGRDRTEPDLDDQFKKIRDRCQWLADECGVANKFAGVEDLRSQFDEIEKWCRALATKHNAGTECDAKIAEVYGYMS